MYKITTRFLTFLSAFLLCFIAEAQDSLRNQKPQMADAMRSNGKIYVVVVVLLIILAGLFIYLIQLDRRIGRLEKNK